MKVKIDQFEEHEGPVRGIHFHPTKDLFVSGGDDSAIKLWNHKLRRCVFTLGAHLDYIRTVEFNNKHPWLISASDDQTVRIWNWETREAIALLAGHNHYVMCARFHPSEDLCVSASLDQTVRVWDLSGLLSYNVNKGRGRGASEGLAGRLNSEFFGGNDAVVKYVLEGHDRGVNWASFHPTLPLIISGADDNQVKLWRMNDTKAWEMDTMRGHSNNVSCVIFHQSNEQDLIVSNSEDRTIRVWDVSKRMGVQTFRREHDRFWIVASHPSRNLLAAGHDSGMMVFKLKRERPAHAFHRGHVFYVKDRYVRKVSLSNNSNVSSDVPMASLGRRNARAGGDGEPKTMLYNKMNNSSHNILLHSDTEGGSYELFTFPKRSRKQDDGGGSSGRRGQGASVAFVEWNKFAVRCCCCCCSSSSSSSIFSLQHHTLPRHNTHTHIQVLEKNRAICIRDMRNEVTSRIPIPVPGVDGLLSGAVASRVILRGEDKLWLFEHTSRNIVNELQAHGVRRVSWDRNASTCAVMSKTQVILCDRDLAQLCVVNEPVNVKGGAWDDCGVFVYTTLNHIKYLLPSGDGGIIRTIDDVVYVVAVKNGVLHCLDRQMMPRRIKIETSEYRFKIALEEKQFKDALSIIKHSSLCGSAIIAYLQQKGFPEVALHFVKDNSVKFDLALECGNIEIALQAAQALDDETCWQRLGEAALRQGNHQVVEMAYQHTKNFEKLSFLYLITGNIDKLEKMRKIAEHRKDVMAQCHNSLYLGDIKGNMELFARVQQPCLAYVTAATHGLEEKASEYRKVLEERTLPVRFVVVVSLCVCSS